MPWSGTGLSCACRCPTWAISPARVMNGLRWLLLRCGDLRCSCTIRIVVAGCSPRDRSIVDGGCAEHHRSPSVPLRVCVVHWRRRSGARSRSRPSPAATSLLRSTVVDNSPEIRDLLHAALVATECSVDIIEQPYNSGYAGGANVVLRGAVAADEGYVLVCAHDAVVQPDTIRALLEAAVGAPGHGVFGPISSDKPSGAGSVEHLGLERIGAQFGLQRSRQVMSLPTIKMTVARHSAACRWRVRRSVLRRSWP